jgi:SAM-dependent methyltransferase
VTTLWSDAAGYESYVGRWSRVIAPAFVAWLDAPRGATWLDCGCGTGALTEAICAAGQPAAVVSLDKSDAYLRYPRSGAGGARLVRVAADGMRAPIASGTIDVVVSGLVLNFVDADRLLDEQLRVGADAATYGAYVWDYGGEYEFVRRFWDAARAVDPAAARLDPGDRFPICHPDALAGLFERHGLTQIRTTRLNAQAEFAGFDEYWSALDVRQGSLAEYLSALDDGRRAAIRERLRQDVPVDATGTVRLRLSAFAVAGSRG